MPSGAKWLPPSSSHRWTQDERGDRFGRFPDVADGLLGMVGNKSAKSASEIISLVSLRSRLLKFLRVATEAPLAPLAPKRIPNSSDSFAKECQLGALRLGRNSGPIRYWHWDKLWRGCESEMKHCVFLFTTSCLGLPSNWAFLSIVKIQKY
jgi:hypothetical protein